jgi:hypothetical protein
VYTINATERYKQKPKPCQSGHSTSRAVLPSQIISVEKADLKYDLSHYHPVPATSKTPIAKPTPLTPHLTNSIHCCSRARLSTSSPLTSSTFSSTTPSFKRFSMARFRLPLAAATRPVQSRYGCLTRAGLRAKAASSDTLAREESVRMCRVARRVVCARV